MGKKHIFKKFKIKNMCIKISLLNCKFKTKQYKNYG